MQDAETGIGPAPDAQDAPGAQQEMLELLQGARRQLERYQKARDEKIAIVGMAGRFPGAEDIDAFWRMIDAEQSGLRTLSEEELVAAGVPEERVRRSDYVPVWGSFEDPTGFDAGFFGYSPREAEVLDPQQRVFLECAWSALEHAGYDPRTHSGRIGIYAGAALNDYLTHLDGAAGGRESIDPLQAILSNVNGMVAARTAFHLDLKGPAVGVQTTCSTSLVTVHQAARSLLAGECDMALAGAVAVGRAKPAGYLHQAEGIGSPDGQCRPFDAAGAGTLFANGAGAVVLKRLSDALADGDTVHAVILGSAVNNDGAAKVGLTAPGIAGQTAVLDAGLSAAGIDPASIDYVEAHGTATALGDPIEVTALNRVYGAAFAKAGRTCALGSVKGNIGHLDAAAGIAGLIKTVLALNHRRLPASLNFETPNPGCDFSAGPFRVAAHGTDWPETAGRPRRAAVSSFGMGGTNAHLILQEAPAAPKEDDERDEGGSQFLPLSARSPEALDALRLALAERLRREPSLPLADVAHTLQTGRRPMPHRLVCLARDTEGAATTLELGEGADIARGAALADTPSPVFVFPGQGAQYPGMARQLHDSAPAFRRAYDACTALLPEDVDLAPLLRFDHEGDAETLNRTEVTQPALFVIEYALARMWQDKGITPEAMIGHSIGEYIAACLAGVFSLEDALKLVVARGRLMQACDPGSMLSVMISQSEARGALSPDIELAAVNGPRNCVLSGSHEAIAALAKRFERSGLGCHILRTSHAFHSAMMEPAAEGLAAVLADVALHAPTMDIMSNVTGDWLREEEARDPDYWVRHMLQAVLFGPGLARVLERENPVLLEVGPGSSLTRLARQQLPEGARVVTTLPDAANKTDAADHALRAFGELWVAGLDVDWRASGAPAGRRRVPLPTYPFERTSYWLAPARQVTAERQATRSKIATDWFHQPVWTRVPTPASSKEVPARWLLLNGAAIKDALGGLPDGMDAILVETGADFAAAGEGYTLDPAEPDHYRALFADLAQKGALPTRIVNGFPLTSKGGDAFRDTFALARAMAPETWHDATLTILTRNAHRVNGGEEVLPRAAMASGLLPVLEQELAGVACQSIDLDAVPPTGTAAGLRETIHAPVSGPAEVLALRGGYGWRRDHARTPLPDPATVSTLRQGATYLVMGDLVEGLGPVYARALVEQLGAKVILIGRAGLPAPGEWDAWLSSHSPAHGISQLISMLREVGEPGRDYLLFSGEIDDPDWLTRTLDEGEAHLGAIAGAFFTAGMGDQHHCPLTLAAPETYAGLFATKIGGVSALAQALCGRHAEFVLVQSSLSTVAGGPGFGAYAAANGFLDALAEKADEPDGPTWQVIDWDACQPHTGEEALDGVLGAAIAPDAVWQATRAALSQPHIRRMIVTPSDLAHRIAEAMEPARPETAATAAKRTKNGRQGVKATYVAPRDAYETSVCEVMGELLGIERIGVDDNFFELGGHSLLAIQVVSRLRRRFEIELPMRALLFEAPTAAGLARVIAGSVEAADAELDAVAAILGNIEADALPAAAK